jgi:drug/metabolite transporter superfamily protein YnfA
MTKNKLYVVASLLIIASLFLIVFGFQSDTRWVWLTGLGAITLAMLISLVTRWIEEEKEPNKDSEESS